MSLALLEDEWGSEGTHIFAGFAFATGTGRRLDPGMVMVAAVANQVCGTGGRIGVSSASRTLGKMRPHF